MRVALLQPCDAAVAVVRAEQRTLDDLGVETLCAAMEFDARGESDPVVAEAVRAVLSTSVVDPEVIRYRHAVLADCCEHPGEVRELYEIASRAARVKRWMVGPAHRPNGKLVLALEPLNELIGCLRRLRSACAGYDGVFGSAGFIDLLGVVADELDEEYLGSVERQLTAMDFDSGIQFCAGLGTGNKVAHISLHEPPRPQRRWFGRRAARAFDVVDDPDPESNPIVQLQNPALTIIADVVTEAADHVQDFFAELRTQLAFYLGCRTMRERLVATGAPVCLPTVHPAGGSRLRCTGLRDAGMCLTSAGPIVGNYVDAADRSLIMVTGANNGGKSTFLRALGLAQLMTQAGMFVTAADFETDVRAGVFTHVVAEEDRTLSHGKLAEELVRMSDLIDRMTPTSLLLCNESFASTGARDAARIAAPLLDALLDSGVHVVFITHLTEFACHRHESDHPHELYLHAERLPNGTRTFRMIPGAPEPDSHADDIFHQVFNRPPHTSTTHR